MENFINYFRFESENESEKEQQEKRNKFLKMGGILILCFLLLNFVLVVVAMHRTTEISSSSSTKIDKELEAREKENGELKKSHEELKEQFESLSHKLDRLLNNVSSNPSVSFPTPPPENEDPENPVEVPESKSATSCSVAMEMEILPSPRSKKQRINPHGNGTSVEVLCDFETDGGGWTIIQKRSSGPAQEFQKNWIDYKNGFGSLNKNFWLGLDNIHALTQNGDQELRIELEDFQGNQKWAKYSNFSISDASDFYQLSISGFYENSTLPDSMTAHDNGQRFSTKDQDNDQSSHNCSVSYGGGGGWWFGLHCSDCTLNGRYFEEGQTVPFCQGIYWKLWKGSYNSMKRSEMKIRTRR